LPWPVHIGNSKSLFDGHLQAKSSESARPDWHL
jgi:hypothetical protein